MILNKYYINSVVFIILLLLLQIIPVSVFSYEIKDIARNVSPSVVLLQIMDMRGKTVSTGTGFFISKEGLIVTNYHVIEDAVTVNAITNSKIKIKIAGKLTVDKYRDLAIIKVKQQHLPLYFEPLRLYKGQPIEPGERVIVVGGPLGLAGTLSEGIVSAIRNTSEIKSKKKRKDSFDILQITAPISPGSSGSPVMNQNGEVIGVVVSQFIVGQNLNFAIPVNEVHSLLDSADINKAVEPFSLKRKYIIITVSVVCAIVFISLIFFYIKKNNSKKYDNIIQGQPVKRKKINSKKYGKIIQGPWTSIDKKPKS